MKAVEILDVGGWYDFKDTKSILETEAGRPVSEDEVWEHIKEMEAIDLFTGINSLKPMFSLLSGFVMLGERKTSYGLFPCGCVKTGIEHFIFNIKEKCSNVTAIFLCEKDKGVLQIISKKDSEVAIYKIRALTEKGMSLYTDYREGRISMPLIWQQLYEKLYASEVFSCFLENPCYI